MTAEHMHPMVALMRRYVIDYTNSHDQSIYPELFVDDYRVNINGVALVRDESYGPAVTQIFADAPGLGLVVHELVLNGDRLCMRFSEHAAWPRPGGGRALTCWQGIGLYKWDGERFTENFVEQDFLSRRRQLATGVPDELEAPHIDPWMTTQPVPLDPAAEDAALAYVRSGRFGDAAWSRIDAAFGADAATVVEPASVVVNDVFSAGDRVAVHATFTGAYRGGIPDVAPEAVGRVVDLPVACLLAMAPDGAVTELRAVTAADVVRSRLLSPG